MTRGWYALVFSAAAVLGACQAKTAGEDKTEALERRIAELEKQAIPSPAPAQSPGEAPAGAASQPAPKAPSSGTTRALPTQTAKRRATPPPAPASRPASEAPSRIERLPESEQRGVEAEPAASRVGAVQPRLERMVLPEGTELTLVLETPVSSVNSIEGDAVVARVERAVSESGRILLPGGTVLKGRVSEALPAGRVKGRARVSVDFNRIVVRGRAHELETTRISAVAPDEHGRDGKIIGGSAAAGAILGAIADGKKGFLRGAVIGAGVGSGAVLVTKGREIELPSGSRWTVRVRETVRL